MKHIIMLLTSFVIAASLMGCQMFWEDVGGAGQPCFTNGQCRAGLSCRAGICQAPISTDGDSETPECQGDAASCDGGWTRSCQGGVWVRITDCTASGKACTDGSCGLIDGDESEVQADLDEDTTDGDLESEPDNDLESETSDGDPEGDTTDSDFDDAAENDRDTLDSDSDDSAENDRDTTDSEVDGDSEVELELETELEEQEPGDDCLVGDCCDNGHWVVVGGACVSGMDTFACTSDTCNTAHACATHTLLADKCLINSLCYDRHASKPGFQCSWCEPSNAPTGWSDKPNTEVCDDGNLCTYGERCDGNGACQAGTTVACTSATNACGARQACNGTDTCTVTYPDAQTSCETDSKSCTDDTCDGAGTCLHTRMAGKCLIDGACYNDGAVNPANECQYCDAYNTPLAWRPKTDATACGTQDQCYSGACVDCTNDLGCGDLADDGNPCSAPACNATTHVCYHDLAAHFTEACGSPTNTTCDKADTCDAGGVCQPNYEATGTTCNDDSACTQPDSCKDGACVGSAYVVCTSHATCAAGTGVCSCDSGYHDESGLCITDSYKRINAGTFTMGSPGSEGGRNSSIETQHSVTLTYGFEMAVHETTQGEFKGLLGYNPSNFQSCGLACPVEEVTWHEALAYANALSAKNGFSQCYDCTGTGTAVVCSLKPQYMKPQDCPGYRLPTEAEWEYAARAGTTTAFYNGGIVNTIEDCGDDTNLDKIGWYCGNAAVSYAGCYNLTTAGGSSCAGTHPVGGKTANAWGLYDMSGNVWEWASDTWDGASDNVPNSVTDPTGQIGSSLRIARGGSWSYTARRARSAFRYHYEPTYRDFYLGFRLVRSLNASTGFTRIPAGSFIMGSPVGELGRSTTETQHSVTLTRAFEISPYETTQAEFAEFAGKNPSWFGPNGDGADCGGACPVERVDWYEALAYSNWLSAKKGFPPCYVLSGCTGTIGAGCATSETTCTSGVYACTSVTLNGVSRPQDCQGFRLPTEAEWEYAARAGTTTAYYSGGISYTDCTADANLNKIGWYCGNSGGTTHVVGGKAANAWGLYDMSGNIWEWMWDRADMGDYGSASVTDPTGSSTSSSRVLRGGTWADDANAAKSAHRAGMDSGSHRARNFGFRLVRSLDAPTFTHIKAGTFTMGSPSGEIGRQTNETAHSVTLTSNFEMKTTLVTQGEFTAFAGTNPSYFSANGGGAACGTNCPVERVNWYEAAAYMNWLSTQKGLTPCYVLSGCTGTLGSGCASGTAGCTSGVYTCTVALNGVSKPQDCTGYRFPTEAEWEYAARAGTTTATYNGDLTATGCTSDSALAPIAWYCFNSGSTTHPVGLTPPNAWGLYDVNGNLYEWVWDWFDGSDYSTGSVTDPTGQSTGLDRGTRGGSWYSVAQYVRSAYRGYDLPGYRYDHIGFRPVRSLP